MDLKFVVKVLIAVLFFSTCVCETNVTDVETQVFEKWVSIRKTLVNFMEELMRMVLPRILAVGYDANISGECMASLLKFFNGIRSFKTWAISMLDASGKVTPGFLSGSFTDLGDYDLCLSLNDETKWSRKTFTGQYCTLQIQVPLPPIPRKLSLTTSIFGNRTLANEDEMFELINKWVHIFYRVPIRAGVCLPSTCSAEDITEISNTVARNFEGVKVEVPRCETKTPTSVLPEQIVVLSLFGFILLITAVCTSVDVLTRKRNPIPRFARHFRHFSLWTNGAKFFGEETVQRTGRLTVLDGIRWWSMAWVCLAHIYGLYPMQAFGSLLNANDYVNDVLFGLISSAWVSVDVFFLMGGLLVAYTTLGQLQNQNGRINFFKNIFRRLWRLTPAMWAVVALIFLLPLLGSGPMWHEIVEKQVELCRSSWWLAALYANSWLGHANACLMSTWYVSADLHLYLVSPVFIYIFYKNKALGFCACLLAIIISCLGMYFLNIKYDLYPFLMLMTFNTETTEEVFTTIYFRPYAHVGPYMVGILIGCYLKAYPKVKARWFVVAIGWCVSVAFAWSVLLGPSPWLKGAFPSAPVAALFQAVHKTVFALSVGWVIWASYYGYAGVVSSLLSWPGYQKLSQFVYLVYLVQLPVLWIRTGSFRSVMKYDHLNFFFEFLGVMVISTVAALILHLVIEAPFISLDSAMFPKTNKKPTLPKVNGETLFPVEERKQPRTNNVECIKIKDLTSNAVN